LRLRFSPFPFLSFFLLPIRTIKQEDLPNQRIM
jgi:hypothetical protein